MSVPAPCPVPRVRPDTHTGSEACVAGEPGCRYHVWTHRAGWRFSDSPQVSLCYVPPMQPAHDLMTKFRVELLGLHETSHWIISVRGKQVTLGACVLLLKRPEPHLSGLTMEEVAELPLVAGWWEAAVSRAFGPDKFNYIAAMMKDPFVHFHAIPRYKSDRRYGGLEWRDDDWPGLVAFRDLSTSDDILMGVRDKLMAASSD